VKALDVSVKVLRKHTEAEGRRMKVKGQHYEEDSRHAKDRKRINVEIAEQAL